MCVQCFSACKVSFCLSQFHGWFTTRTYLMYTCWFFSRLGSVKCSERARWLSVTSVNIRGGSFNEMMSDTFDKTFRRVRTADTRIAKLCNPGPRDAVTHHILHTHSFVLYLISSFQAEVVEPGCRLPQNFSGDWINTANIDADVFINETHIIETYYPDEGRYRRTIYVCR